MARFARRARLLKPDEFKAAFERGRRINESVLAAVVCSNPHDHARLGLAVAKKSVPLATARNRIKRQVRESFRLHQHRLPAVDIVILTRPGILKAGAADLRSALDALWRRIAP